MKSTTRATGKPGGLAISMVSDGLANVVTGMGTGADKRTFQRWTVGGAFLGGDLLDQNQVAAAYMTDWLVAKVHDLPAEEMTKAWREWQNEIGDITKLEEEEKRLGLRQKMEDAIREGLLGGCAIIMGLPGASSEPAPKTIGEGELAYLLPVSRWELSTPEFDQDVLSPNFRQPTHFRLSAGQTYARIHPSRVVVFPGKPRPNIGHSFTIRDRFWGAPLLERINEAMKNAALVQNIIPSLLEEAKTDVISIPGLMELVSTQKGEAQLANRLLVAQQMKSAYKATILDGGEGKKDGEGAETWETRQLSFAQLPEIAQTFLQIAAGAADIPLTRLLGTQAKGLNATGEGDENNFIAMITSRQNTYLRPRLDRIDHYLKQSAGVAAEVTYKFGPIKKMTPKEEAEIDKLVSETFEIIAKGGLIQHDALATTLVNVHSERQNFPGLADNVKKSTEEIPAKAAAEMEAEAMRAGNDNEARKVDIMAKGASASGRVRAVSRDSIMEDAAPRSLYVARKVFNPVEIMRWAKASGIPDLVPGADLHVTVMYSLTPVDWMKAPRDWHEDDKGRLRIPPGGPRALERFGPNGDVAVLRFNAPSLEYRFDALKDIGAVSKWPTYEPHITLAFDLPRDFDLSKVEPYTGRIVLGPELWREIIEDWTPPSR